jgi:hypothetical protein
MNNVNGQLLVMASERDEKGMTYRLFVVVVRLFVVVVRNAMFDGKLKKVMTKQRRRKEKSFVKPGIHIRPGSGISNSASEGHYAKHLRRQEDGIY